MIKLLVIEDDEEMCEELKVVLEAENYFVKIFHSGDEGLNFIENDGYEIVLLDLKIPGISGREVLRRIKKNYPLIKVIVLTGSPIPKNFLQEKEERELTNDNSKDLVLQLADYVINKPFDPSHLITIINKLKN